MKKLFRASVFVLLYLLLSACGGASQSAPTPDSSLGVTLVPTSDPFIEYWIQTSLADTPTATATLVPTQTAVATMEVTPTQAYIPPTLIPTIDPTLVPELLSNAFSVQAMEGVNGHKIRQITGWGHGFGTIVPPYYYCPSYAWLDTNHILLYPVTGERDEFVDGASRFINIVLQPVVTNLDSGASWLPPVNISPLDVCNRVYWSPTLGVLISSQLQGDVSTISTYTHDGDRVSSYTGSIIDISPSRTKILLAQDTLLDLRTNKTIKLDWSLEDYHQFELTDLFWTADEKRVYRCCYFYADLTTGTSYRFERSDFQDTDGNHLDPFGLWFHQGEWVRDDKYFLVSWLAVDDGPVRYLPLFDPATKLFYDVMGMAELPSDWEAVQTTASPDGNYVLLKGWEDSYLVNLVTFKAQYYAYPDLSDDMDIWSSDSKFMWFQSHDSHNESTEFQILSIPNGKLSPLHLVPLPNSNHWWHPTKAVVAYPAADKNALIFLGTSTMSYQELPFTLQKEPYASDRVVQGAVVWSPNGEKLALVAEDGSLWQIDYPKLENLEQLTPPLTDVNNIEWSPDGNSIAFVSGSDIYIVDTMK